MEAETAWIRIMQKAAGECPAACYINQSGKERQGYRSSCCSWNRSIKSNSLEA